MKARKSGNEPKKRVLALMLCAMFALVCLCGAAASGSADEQEEGAQTAVLPEQVPLLVAAGVLLLVVSPLRANYVRSETLQTNLRIKLDTTITKA